MTHKNFSFWFCTLLSGFIFGIASQRIPAASMPESPKTYSYCRDLQPAIKSNCVCHAKKKSFR